MASPQKENGYTGIANEILEHITKLPLSGTQFRILMVVWRFTYGFSRKDHDLSESFISKAIGVSKRYVCKEMNKLIEFNILQIKKFSTYTTSRKIAFNKDYESWEYRTIVPLLNNKSTVEHKDSTTVEQSISTTVEQSFHQERNIKTNINIINTIADIKKFYEDNGFGLLIPSVLNDINSFLDDDIECELVIQAMKISIDNGVHKWSYVKKILSECLMNKIITLEQFRIKELERESNKFKKQETSKKSKTAEWV